MLAEQDQDMTTLAVIELYIALQTSAKIITATGLVAYACPGDARILGERAAVDAQHRAGVQRGDGRRSRWRHNRGYPVYFIRPCHLDRSQGKDLVRNERQDNAGHQQNREYNQESFL